VPERAAVEKVSVIYGKLLEEERKHADKQAGLAASTALMKTVLAGSGVEYDEFVFSLMGAGD
jgi:hypothetical protein